MDEEQVQEAEALDKKYRPKSFDEVAGNPELLMTIRSILSRPTGIPSSFLLEGPSGCGKTTLSRIIARELGGTDSTIKEYNISNMTGVDTARKIIDHARFKPFGGRKKIYILNECHKSSNAWQNAMLEVLEEPPSYIHFILCTTEPNKLLKTILTRCTRLPVKPLRSAEVVSLLDRVCQEEDVRIAKEVLSKIAQSCEGSPRQALVMLDAVIDCKAENQMECINKFSLASTNTLILCQALMDKKSWGDVVQVILNLENEPEETRLGILSYMEKVLLQPIKGKPGQKHLRAWEIIEAMSGGIFHRRAQLTAKCFELINS